MKAGKPKQAPAAVKPKQAPAASKARHSPGADGAPEKIELHHTRSKAKRKVGNLKSIPESDSETLEDDPVDDSPPPKVYGRGGRFPKALPGSKHPVSSGTDDVFMGSGAPSDEDCPGGSEFEADSASFLKSRKIAPAPHRPPPADPGPVFPCPTYISDSFGENGAWVRPKWNPNAWDFSCKRGKAYTRASPEFGTNILRAVKLMKLSASRAVLAR